MTRLVLFVRYQTTHLRASTEDAKIYRIRTIYEIVENTQNRILVFNEVNEWNAYKNVNLHKTSQSIYYSELLSCTMILGIVEFLYLIDNFRIEVSEKTIGRKSISVLSLFATSIILKYPERNKVLLKIFINSRILHNFYAKRSGIWNIEIYRRT